MKIPHFHARYIAPNVDVPETVTIRGYIYSLRRARVFPELYVYTEYKLRCR